MNDLGRPGPIELVCFDLGGVLIRVRESWPRTFALAGVGDVEAVMAPVDPTALHSLMLAFELGQVAPERFFAQAAALFGLEVELVRRALLLWLDRPYDGLEALLDRLRSAGLQTACLSNTNVFHWEVMTGAGERSLPLGHLDHRFASFRLGLVKPDPRVYEAVERRVGVSPGAIAFYDDRPVNVEAARARGWQVQQIDPARDPISAIARDLERLGALTG